MPETIKRISSAADLETVVSVPARPAAAFDKMVVDQVLFSRPDGPNGRLMIEAVGLIGREVELEREVWVEDETGEVTRQVRTVTGYEVADEAKAPGTSWRRVLSISDGEQVLGKGAVTTLESIFAKLAPLLERSTA